MADRYPINDPKRSVPPPHRGFNRRRAAGAGRVAALHVCPSCASELVYPLDWAPANRRRWKVDLRCPACEWRGAGTYTQDMVDRFDDQLDLGTEKLLTDLALLTRANMEEQAERFITALNADWILPEDF